LKAFELHHSGSSVEENPEGKKKSKGAFFSIFSKIQRSSFMKADFKRLVQAPAVKLEADGKHHF
jgi:hypothetical protein